MRSPPSKWIKEINQRVMFNQVSRGKMKKSLSCTSGILIAFLICLCNGGSDPGSTWWPLECQSYHSKKVVSTSRQECTAKIEIEYPTTPTDCRVTSEGRSLVRGLNLNMPPMSADTTPKHPASTTAVHYQSSFKIADMLPLPPPSPTHTYNIGLRRKWQISYNLQLGLH